MIYLIYEKDEHGNVFMRCVVIPCCRTLMNVANYVMLVIITFLTLTLVALEELCLLWDTLEDLCFNGIQ